MPMIVAGIGLAASVAGAGLGAAGAIEGGQANKAMYDYQSGIALQNQQIDLQNAGYALQSGEQNASQSGMASRFQIGQIKTAQGASGTRVSSGTNADVVSGQELIANTEQTTIRSNSAKAAYDFTVGATQAGEQAGAYSSAGVNAVTAGDIGAGSSIIGGAGSVATKWLQGSQVGAFNSNPFGL